MRLCAGRRTEIPDEENEICSSLLTGTMLQ